MEKETTDCNNHVNASEELDKDNLEEAHKEEQESKKIERQEKSKRKHRTARKKKRITRILWLAKIWENWEKSNFVLSLSNQARLKNT